MARAWPYIAVLAAVAVTPALAQQGGGPIRLSPLAPVTGTPEQPAPQSEGQTRGNIPPGGIRVQGLDAVRDDSLGIISDEAGGLGADIWSGTRRADAVRLLRSLPDAYPYRAAHDLARRLLSTAARAPAATSEGAGGAEEGLLGPRIDRLAAMGDGADAVQLARATGGTAVPDRIAAPAVRGYFAQGDIVSGCGVADGYRGGYGDAFWQQVLIVCQVAAGNSDQAALGLDLMREQGISADPLFARLALTLSGGGKIKLEPDEEHTPDALTLALLMASGTKLPDWLVADAPPGQLPAILSVKDLDPDVRLQAAHRALRHGVLDAAQVQDIYAGLGAGEGDIAAALVDPAKTGPDRLLAYLYLAAEAQAEPIPRSEALTEAWSRAREIGLFDVAALVTADLLETIPVTPDYGWLSATAAEVALVAGRKDNALEWYRLVTRQAPIVPGLAEATVTLWPAMRTVGRAEPGAIALTAGTGVAAAVSGRPTVAAPPRGPVPWSAARLERWIEQTRVDQTGGEALDAPDQAKVLAMLTGLDDPVDDNQWRLLPEGTPQTVVMPPPGILEGLARAGAAGLRGEAALYALHALGASTEPPHGSVAGAVVAALDAAGLHADAEAIAREVVAGEIPARTAP